MKKPFYFYGNGKSPADLHAKPAAGDTPYLVLPLSEVGKDFLVGEAEYVIKVALDSGIKNPRVIGTAVLDAWLKQARGSNTHGPQTPAPVFTVPPAESFLEELSKSIEWHYQNTKDPYNIDHAAISILSSIRISWAISTGLTPRKLVTEKKEDVQ